MKFDKFLVSALKIGAVIGAVALGVDVAMAATPDVVALPTGISTPLNLLGLKGITDWTYALLAVAGGLAIAFAVMRKVKQGAANI